MSDDEPPRLPTSTSGHPGEPCEPRLGGRRTAPAQGLRGQRARGLTTHLARRGAEGSAPPLSCAGGDYLGLQRRPKAAPVGAPRGSKAERSGRSTGPVTNSLTPSAASASADLSAIEETFAIDDLLERVHSALPPAALMCAKRTCSRWRLVAATVLESRLAAAEAAIQSLRDPAEASQAHVWLDMLGKMERLFSEQFGENHRMIMEKWRAALPASSGDASVEETTPTTFASTAAATEPSSTLTASTIASPALAATAFASATLSTSSIAATAVATTALTTIRLLASYENGGRPCHVRGERSAREGQVISCIAAFIKLTVERFHLVIVPKESIAHWLDAFKQRAPELAVHVSDQTSTPAQRRRIIRECTAPVLLTTYPIALKDLAELKRQLPQSVWFDEGAAHLRINPSSTSTDPLFQLTHHVGGCLRPLCVFLLGSAAPAKCDVYQHYRWALEFYFASSNWRGLQPSSKHLTCEREAVELATKALAAALPEAHHQSGGRLQEFVEMAFAWRYRSLLVTSGFLDLEGQPEMATSPAGGAGGVK